MSKKRKTGLGRMSEADYAILSYVMQERLLVNTAEARMNENHDNDDFCRGLSVMTYALGYDCGKDKDGKWAFVKDVDGLPKKEWARTSELLLEITAPFTTGERNEQDTDRK